ncbi:PIG-L deacetylase family protein [Pseudomonas matsuisoli]|uniref:Acetylglucosaminylphosphatidylinositol deacetylase n=1 Tax=Pseudomonas matsuisoli TaxID=1515666 RepID=A0A917PNX9_9PSED|nr:PIG-L family deacetylase [Pseudomonas matsuisoli]GGJ86222.1 acetylglucosaminylphosphatidylinositol deacetylase [Pseudomonas matsuisoli]
MGNSPLSSVWKRFRPAVSAGEKSDLLQGKGTPWTDWKSSARISSLSPIEPKQIATLQQRVVIIAPHPGFETVACGGLLQRFSKLGCPILLISLTDGSGSHAGSSLWTPERLSAIRPQESAESLRRLGLPLNRLKWIRGGFQDGGLESEQDRLAEFLLRYIQPDDVIFTSWRQDGHTDHETTGMVAGSIAESLGASLYEVPVWAWHWAEPNDARIPWYRLRKLPLSRWTVARKRHAIQAHASQLMGDPEIGEEPAFGTYTQQRTLQPYEIILTPTVTLA